MEEIVDTEEEVLVTESYATVVVVVGAEGSESGILPEVDAAGDFEVASADACELLVGIFGGEVIVDEEEGVAPLVSIVTLEGCGEMISSKVIECLEVGLSIGGHAECEHCRSSKNNFFHNDLWL